MVASGAMPSPILMPSLGTRLPACLAPALSPPPTHRPPARPAPPPPWQECHCMLFLTEDNDFRGEEQHITLDELVDMTKDM